MEPKLVQLMELKLVLEQLLLGLERQLWLEQSHHLSNL
jgi:hypothetical protein